MFGQSRFRQLIVTVINQCLIVFLCSITLSFAYLNFYFEKRSSKSVHSSNLSKDKGTKLLNINYSRINGKISILIATKNESRNIGKVLRNLELATYDKSLVEIVIIDVGSKDNTVEIAKASAGVIPIIFIKKPQGQLYSGGRGTALNEGFTKCTGDIIFIMRADSIVSPGYDVVLRKVMSTTGVLFTSFRFAADKRGLATEVEPSGLWLIEYFFNIRSYFLSFPSAMQGIIIHAQTFRVHNFTDNAIMDDIEFILRYRKLCSSAKLTYKLLDLPLYCSPTRWEAVGVLLWILLDCFAYILFVHLCVSPEYIYTICYEFLPNLFTKRQFIPWWFRR